MSGQRLHVAYDDQSFKTMMADLKSHFACASPQFLDSVVPSSSVYRVATTHTSLSCLPSPISAFFIKSKAERNTNLYSILYVYNIYNFARHIHKNSNIARS